MKTEPNDELQAVNELFSESQGHVTDSELGDQICYFIDEILGNNPEERGLLNAEGSLNALEQMMNALKEIATLDQIDMHKRKKFEAYAHMVEERLNKARSAADRRNRIHRGISDTRGGFSAFKQGEGVEI